MNVPRLLQPLGVIGTAMVVGALLVVFGALSFTAVLGKSATYDEPLHVVGGIVHRFEDDYRINPEDPALFGWWASLPHSAGSLKIDTSSPFYQKATTGRTDQQWYFVINTLYARSPHHPDDFLNLSRAMFVPLGMALGALIACWAYQIGGSWAAIAAATLFCFDPNFLAHSALVKNDVPLSLTMCMLGYCLWRFGRGGGWFWLALAALACGIGFNVKFSAVLMGPMLVLLLCVRALLPTPWTIAARKQHSARQRAAVIVIGAVITLAAIVVVTWCVYGFRFAATADGRPLVTTQLISKLARNNVITWLTATQARTASGSDMQQMAADEMKRGDFAWPVRLDLWMKQHRLLPEGWLFGFLYTYVTTLVRSTYLLGHVGLVGTWYYFPVAMFFKTPTATIIALMLVPLGCIANRRARKVHDSPSEAKSSDAGALDWWTPLVLTIPPAIYFFAALATNLNLGLRHILPVYPYLFVALGAGSGTLLQRWPRTTGVVAVALLLGLATESVAAYPDYIPFFNILGGGAKGGLELLGDSNLDWGQDLPALAKWQRVHPAEKLYLCYFGMADPSAYGIHYVNLLGGWPFAPTTFMKANEHGVVAISATNLQGIYIGEKALVAYMNAFDQEKPFDVLDGTIYLYTWPPKKRPSF